MPYFTIIWTLICAIIIIGYPLYLFNATSRLGNKLYESSKLDSSNTVELISFDIRDFLPGWSVTLDVPQLTEEVIRTHPILFYLESEETCLKLPLNNASFGYAAHVYKNVGKVYITFKSLKDGVTNFYVPAWHLSKLKILIIKSKKHGLNRQWCTDLEKLQLQNDASNAKINVYDYEDMLGYLSNIATIDFKGHFRAMKMKKVKRPLESDLSRKENLFSTTA